MAATGKTPILLYGSTTATNTPVAGNLTNSADGCEIAINVADKNLFFKDATNTVNTVPIRQSSGSSDGWLSSTDWSTFNNKQAALGYTPVNKAGDTMTGSLTSPSFIPSSSTVPANGLYLPTTNTFGLAANSTALVSGTSTVFSVLAGKTLRLNRSDNATYNEISYAASDKFLFNQANGGTYNFAVAGTEVAGISAAGQLSGSSLSVSSTVSVPGLQANNTNASFSSTLNYLTTTRAATTSFDFIGAYANSVAQFRVDGAGNTITTGNFVVGTSGKGIDFSATAGTGTSELLADYEEGTWTPVLSDGTNNATMAASSSNLGKYVKVGNQVTVTANIVVANIGSVSGAVRITGLPYTVGSGAGSYSAVSVGYATGLVITAGQNVAGYAAINQTYLALTVWTATTGTSAMTNTQFPTNGNIIISVTYTV